MSEYAVHLPYDYVAQRFYEKPIRASRKIKKTPTLKVETKTRAVAQKTSKITY